MSSFLYSLGRWSYRARRFVIGLWIGVLVLCGTGALLFNQGFDNSVSIPGTESQEALDSLAATFPQVSGASANIIVVAPDGEKVTDAGIEDAVDDAVSALEDVDGVETVTSPYDDTVSGQVNDDETAAMINIQLTAASSDVSDATKEDMQEVSDDLGETLGDDASVALGGALFSQKMPELGATESVGLIVALVVLFLTFGSFLAAGLPLVTALIGVGVSMTLVLIATAFGSVTSTTPMLGLMLGIAVGIDYALFIISRHRDQLAEGLGVEESIARAVATAGSAVTFAGLTVIIALLGLGVAGIPFLTVMGVAAAAGVAIAVLVSLTMLPALLGTAGERMRPKAPRAPRSDRKARRAQRAAAVAAGAEDAGGQDAEAPSPAHAHAPAKRPNRFYLGWVRLVTRRPIVTIVAVVLALGIATIPALGLRLALPDAGGLPEDDEARQNYDLIAEYFGEGANGVLIVTGSIITSDDPLTLMEDLGDEIADLPGVAEVPLSTPNETADTGIVQVVPEDGPNSDETAALVQEIRDLHDHFLDEYGIDISVTGVTAVGIDVSELLFEALLPFGVLVVGLSLILLAMVFRSIAVPLKATLGYLLSVGASFGVVVLVFQNGVLGDFLNVAREGPILSFLPIILMGVLFGLAMDYEVFLVSRIREDYVHNGGDARKAIETGFTASAKVVTAAAVIMFAVFAAFIPTGDVNIKPIALGLAVGVFVDAFIVRMTLVPAVLSLLGDKAWWMPRWLDRLLPSFDVEGEALAHEIALREWPAPNAEIAIAADDLEVTDRDAVVLPPTSLRVAPGETHVVTADDPLAVSAALLALTGRMPSARGTVKVLGMVLPARGPQVRARAGYVALQTSISPVEDVRQALAERPALLAIDGLEHLTEQSERDAVRDALHEARRGSEPLTVLLGTTDPVVADAVATVDGTTIAAEPTHPMLASAGSVTSPEALA